MFYSAYDPDRYWHDAGEPADPAAGLLKEGRPVHTGIAVFTPVIDTQGNFSVSVRVDKRITAALNVPGEFYGNVHNSENIGKSSPEFVAQWNENHPDNLIGQEQPPFQAAPGLLMS